MEEKEVNEKVAELEKKVNVILELDKLSEMVKNNQIEFEHKGVQHRAVKPTYKQKQEANEKRVEKFSELMRNDRYMMEDTLIELYKKKGIDIKEIDNKLIVLEKERQELMFKLGQAIKELRPNDELTIYKAEIQKINSDYQEMAMRRTVLMDTSLECQVNVYVYTYMTYLITEKKDGDQWKKAWQTYDEFMSSDESLINLAVFYGSFLSKLEL